MNKWECLCVVCFIRLNIFIEHIQIQYFCKCTMCTIALNRTYIHWFLSTEKCRINHCRLNWTTKKWINHIPTIVGFFLGIWTTFLHFFCQAREASNSSEWLFQNWKRFENYMFTVGELCWMLFLHFNKCLHLLYHISNFFCLRTEEIRIKSLQLLQVYVQCKL